MEYVVLISGAFGAHVCKLSFSGRPSKSYIDIYLRNRCQGGWWPELLADLHSDPLVGCGGRRAVVGAGKGDMHCTHSCILWRYEPSLLAVIIMYFHRIAASCR